METHPSRCIDARLIQTSETIDAEDEQQQQQQQSDRRRAAAQRELNARTRSPSPARAGSSPAKTETPSPARSEILRTARETPSPARAGIPRTARETPSPARAGIPLTAWETPSPAQSGTPGAGRGETPSPAQNRTPGAGRGETPSPAQNRTPGSRRGETPSPSQPPRRERGRSFASTIAAVIGAPLVRQRSRSRRASSPPPPPPPPPARSEEETKRDETQPSQPAPQTPVRGEEETKRDETRPSQPAPQTPVRGEPRGERAAAEERKESAADARRRSARWARRGETAPIARGEEETKSRAPGTGRYGATAEFVPRASDRPVADIESGLVYPPEEPATRASVNVKPGPEHEPEPDREPESEPEPEPEAVGRRRLWRELLQMPSISISPLYSLIEENKRWLDSGVVLPCGPSDAEKVSYHTTGRHILVGSGIFSFTSLLTGMWLFSMSAIYFYWYAFPTIFCAVYFISSYMGVAIWGRDFDPGLHEMVLRAARAVNFCPTVDVFLPVCNEPLDVLDNTWKYVSGLDYDKRKIKIHVLDDGAKEEVRTLANIYGFEYIRRTNRPYMKKAGNLRYAFQRTHGDFIVILDADFCPRRDFLHETLPYMLDPKIAIVQTPQFFRYRREQKWVERGAGMIQELFYRVVQVNRNKFDAAICVGSCGLYRREVLALFGGTAEIGYSEDVHTGFNCSTRGYKVQYVPRVLAMGTCPDEPRAFFMQQYRWCMGSSTLLSNPEFWTSPLNLMQKLCYLSGMLYYSATAMSIFLGPLPGLLLILFKPSAVFFYNVTYAIPSILFSVFVVPFWASQRQDLSCQRVRIIQSYAHFFAIRDRLMCTSIPWVPTGGGAASRSVSKAYDSSVRLMLVWITIHTMCTIGGTVWRLSEYHWHNFLPSVVLAIGNYALHLSTLLT